LDSNGEVAVVDRGQRVDTSVATLRLPSGALVQIDSTRRIGYGYDERIEVLGSSGMIEARRQRTGSVSRYQAGQIIDDGLHPGWFERASPPTLRSSTTSFAALIKKDRSRLAR
jgi:myo-inositol 2-dehydrogenase / D-chiro-inositol 1-dehydrogenase